MNKQMLSAASLARKKRKNLLKKFFCVAPRKISCIALISASRRFLLEKKLRELRVKSVAPGTLRTRRVQWNSYLVFCTEYAFTALPASPQTLSLYVAHLFDRLQFSSIQNYLAAVASLHINSGFPKQDFSHPLIKSTVEGARRQRAEFPNQKNRH